MPKRNGALTLALAGALLALAVTAPLAAERETGTMAASSCDLLLQQSGGRSPFLIPPNAGVNQPIAFVGNVAACSLTVDPMYYSYGRLDLLQWDPATLAPDPTTVALRTRSFTTSGTVGGIWPRADFAPPVVTRSAANVAEPPRPSIAIDWRVTDSYNPHTVRFESDGAPRIPEALQYPPGGGPRTPLQGGHAVLSHAVCGGDEALQRLQVIQSVMRTDSLSDTSCYELLQRFRVPVRSTLRWVEVAFGVRQRPRYYDPVIAILDAQGQRVPPMIIPPSLVEAPYSQYVSTPFWGSHYDFDRYITLEPDHDYWLLVRVEHIYYLYSRALLGNENRDFTTSIGPYYRRTAANADWIQEPAQALCFRLIGVPPPGARQPPRGRLRERELGEIGPGDQPPPGAPRIADPATAGVTREPGPLSLRVAPNPSAGAAFVSWSGAAGPLRVEVLDAQGRRVGGMAGVTGSEGRWLWSAARDDGRPMPAGVYFVRASDGLGRVVTHRVVLIR
jgi:hypothetical protein